MARASRSNALGRFQFHILSVAVRELFRQDLEGDVAIAQPSPPSVSLSTNAFAFEPLFHIPSTVLC